MKMYIKPAIKVRIINYDQCLLAGSGVTDGSNPGKEYNSGDVTYSKEASSSMWSDFEKE